MKQLLILSLATLGLVVSSPIAAQENATLVVSFSDLDLSTHQGIRTLDRRLRSAAEAACGPVSDADLEGKNQALQCRVETLRFARAQRDRALVARQQHQPIQVAIRR